MTYNNLSVLHKQLKRSEQAATYVKKVIAVEEKMPFSAMQQVALA